MKKSTHKAEIVSIKLEKHNNADSLSIVRVFGYQIVVRTQDWKDGDLAAYVVPDSMVQNKDPFKFLFKPEDSPDKWQRVTIKRFRGEVSMGLLIPAPKGSKLGQDVAEKLGIIHYEPPVKGEPQDQPRFTHRQKFVKGVVFKVINLFNKYNLPTKWLYHILIKLKWISNVIPTKPPTIYVPDYDVDSIRRYSYKFIEGELVSVSEKIHGCCSSYVWNGDKLHCKSHYNWKPFDNSNVWGRTIQKYPKLIDWMKEHPDTVIFGEVYGFGVQNMTYDCIPNETKLKVFDVWKGGKYYDVEEAREMLKNTDAEWVPLLGVMPYNLEKLKEIAEQDSVLYKGLREGIVIKPTKERTDQHIGRVQLKLVSNRYLESK